MATVLFMDMSIYGHDYSWACLNVLRQTLECDFNRRGTSGIVARIKIIKSLYQSVSD
jgi:hypothetical protein